MNKFPRILSLLLIVLLVAGCSAATGEEPAALQSANESATTAEEAATVAPTRQPQENEMLEAIPAEPEEGEQTAALPESNVPVESEAVEPVVVDLSQITPEASNEGEAREMPMPGVPDVVVLFVAKASEDLASRLGIDVSEVTLVETEFVQWRDSSLGCPEPGQMYLMVLTSGYRLVLEAGGESYEYHTDTREKVVFCENPEPGAGIVNPDS